MLNKEKIENSDYRNVYLQEPISILTKENLDKLEEHCKKAIHFERGIEHSVTLELLYEYKQLKTNNKKLIEKLEKDIQINQENYNTNCDGLEDYWNGCIDTDTEILEIVKGEK